jgi:hypothetical protein
MLYQTETGFIDVVIEPQFDDHKFGSRLCSVRSTDLGSLQRMKNSVRGEIDFRQHDQLFPFTGFAYLDDLARELKTKSILKTVDCVESDFTRSPAAYTFLGFEEPDEWGLDGDTWQGDIYPDEVHDFQFSVEASFEYFRVWPLFHVPASLREEVEP